MKRIIPALLAAAVVVLAVIVFTGGDKPYVVYVKANDAGGVLKNYNVKIGQVAAGKIADISLDKQDHAVIKLEMDKGAYPIGKGASAKIRPVNLLGEKYVDLNPGDLKQPLPSGTTIQPDKTAIPIELDDALNTLDPDTRAGMRILINEAGLAMAGRGADFNKTLESLPPALDAAKRVVAEVNQDNGKLESLITSGDRVLATVAPKSNDLGDLVNSAANALETAAQRRVNLGRTIQSAPGALNQLRSTLVKLQAASSELTPAADDLRATAPQLNETLTRVPAFTKDAKATLAEVSKVSPALSRLGTKAAPTLRALRPTANHLASFTGDIRKFVDTLDQGGGTKDFLGFVNGWTSVTGSRDALGHVFRLAPTLTYGSITSITNRPPAKSARSGRRTAPKADRAPGASAPAAATPAAPVNPVKPVTDQLGKTVKDVTDAVTGLLGGKKDGSPPATSAPSGDTGVGKVLNYLLGS
ncbi:MAG: hypothetical protein JWM31_3632 [Solirubrobacterales bacterium]|nr:hypothetical protein [Solirubrobacterales bacterium]